MTPEILTELVAKTSLSPGGGSARFIKIDDEWGLKLYRNEETRDNAYSRQGNMSAFGYAPKIGMKFDVGTEFGFVTQVAVPLVEGKLRDKKGHSQQNWSDYHNVYQAGQQANQHLQPEIDDLVKNMIKKGYDISWDDHYANFGMLDGKVVCIDFS